eukprot:2495472-Karenia_brevis.AAC.1
MFRGRIYEDAPFTIPSSASSNAAAIHSYSVQTGPLICSYKALIMMSVEKDDDDDDDVGDD